MNSGPGRNGQVGPQVRTQRPETEPNTCGNLTDDDGSVSCQGGQDPLLRNDAASFSSASGKDDVTAHQPPCPRRLCLPRSPAMRGPLPPWWCVSYHLVEQQEPGPSERGREEARERRHPLTEEGSPQEGTHWRVWGGHRDAEDSISHTLWAEGGQRGQQWAQQRGRARVHSSLGAGGADGARGLRTPHPLPGSPGLDPLSAGLELAGRIHNRGQI